MRTRMQLFIDILAGVFVFLGGALATAWVTFQEQPSTFENAVLGPLGALALAMLVIYGLMKYLKSEQRESKEAMDRLLKDKDRAIDRLIEENDRLRERLSGGSRNDQ